VHLHYKIVEAITVFAESISRPVFEHLRHQAFGIAVIKPVIRVCNSRNPVLIVRLQIRLSQHRRDGYRVARDLREIRGVLAPISIPNLNTPNAHSKKVIDDER